MPSKKPNKAELAVKKIFKSPEIAYGLEEFSGVNMNEALYITEEERKKYFVKDLKSGSLRQVYNEKNQTGKPEEIVRQLWLYKLNQTYGYPFDRIEVEKSVHFGREIRAKSADIVVYKKDKITPYIIFEVKKPDEKKGIEQLKIYLSAEGSEIGVWSNGREKIILYRPYPREYEDSLSEIPRADQAIDDLFDITRTWQDLDPKFDLVHIVKSIEEVALAGSGANVFEEIFKIIYAKLYDEKLARERRRSGEVFFKKYKDPERTYTVINDQLFKEAIKEWPETFEDTDKIRLSPERLNVCISFLEKFRLFEAGQRELEIIDQAFEHLITEVSKGKKGQYFTPRHVIKMCVKMMNPTANEHVIDPACGSGGFLLHTMYHVWETLRTESAKQAYAARYIYGIDFDDNMRRISQALMLIAGDGKHHIFKRNSLDARDWRGAESVKARAEMRPILHQFNSTSDTRENEKTFRFLDFDLLLTNPPFAGENPDQGLLRQYELAKKDGKLKNNVERHILFIERSLDAIKPGGRLAIVLPQGVLNNTTMQYIREWLFEKGRILAVVGLHGNTFKPHTGTKTSVLFLQKWGGDAGAPQKNYTIFMAVSQRPGKDNSGEYVYKKDDTGNFVFDPKGRKVLDHDLDQIADKFIGFAKKERFSFWTSK